MADRVSLPKLLDRLEKHYGKLRFGAPTRVYELLIYLNSGYPASDENCLKGFTALKREIGIAPQEILAAREVELAKWLRLGGIVPELRAARLKEIAGRTHSEFGGDLQRLLKQPLATAKRMLRQFPTIGDPGAERVLLFAGSAPVAAVPANCLHVPLRLGFGREGRSYASTYRCVQGAFEAALPKRSPALRRAYLLIRHHALELCKRSAPRCIECPLVEQCAYFRRAAR